MIWLYWAIRRQIEHRRRTAAALHQMRRNDYVADWHDVINKKRDWNKYTA